MMMMDFHYLLLWGSLALCLTMTAGGMLVIFRRDRHPPAGFSYLQYFHVLCHVYGYYGLWSTVLLAYFGEAAFSATVSPLITLLGSPFFLLALVMQVLWVNGRRARPLSRARLTLLLTAIPLLVLLTWAAGWLPTTALTALIAGSGLLVSLLVMILLWGEQRRPLAAAQRAWLVGLLLAIALWHLVRLLQADQASAAALISIPLFYLLHSAFVVIYAYAETAARADLLPSAEHSDRLEPLLAPYGISRRELDIVRGIYAGKTNQEIADALFITLQTVKDHCSRIYQKVQVKNRSQLATRIREQERQHLP